MPDDMQPDVRVTLTVEVRDPNNYANEEPVVKETFTAAVSTDANRYELARRNVAGLAASADKLLYRREQGR